MSSAELPLGAGPRAQPAWKREILERKRAKLAGAAGGEPEPPAGERLVVAESLGPLRENPFMRLESERRRLRQGLPGHGPEAARPLQQLLELYSAVPGIRTIRADNILIIESQPDAAACFAEGDALPGRRRDPAAASSPPRRPDPLRELLSRRGAALAEIRADQVVIYEAAEPPEQPEAAEPGTVSRLLEKFGQRPRGRRRRGGKALTGPGVVPAAPPQRGGSTFTVVPKRKPVASGLQTLTAASGREEEEEEEESKGKGKAVENADGPQVGVSHKKRYPTVNEIEVIGGYLSLERSCMSKTGSRRKKLCLCPVLLEMVSCENQVESGMLAGTNTSAIAQACLEQVCTMKISFNETSLQTMFEYPSESSLAEEEEEEEEEGHASETEEDKSRTFYIPRPNSTLHPSTPNSDLSSYTPKHSVKFSTWQEQKYEEIPTAEGPLAKEADSHGTQVMLTPAEKGGLSDFSSEPALYF
ncbi:Tprn [Columba livia]|nr:Tprn [Columba livia]